jgi:hypothetical protein
MVVTNKDLMKRNQVYQAVYQQMLGYQYAYLGGYTFKQYVRKKRPSEDSALWIDLINNTVAQPISRYIVDTINDVLFDPPVKRNLQFATPEGKHIDPKNNEWVDLFCLDADLQNRDLTGFMEQVGDLTSIFGHCWIAVDMPQESEGNLGRPYCVAINPLNVWDWEWTYYCGRPLVKYVKVMENEDPHYYYIKCYHLGTSEKPSCWYYYKVPKQSVGSKLDETAELLGEGEYPPGMSVPVFIAYGRRDPRTIDLGVSDIDAASDCQREHYKLECEKYTSIQFAKTIIRAEKGIAVPAQAGAIVRATKDQVESISVNVTDVQVIIQAQQDLLEQIEALTGLGGLRTSKNQVQSGVSIIEERKTLHKTAKAKARLMEVVEEMIFTYAARFMNCRWAGEVVYDTNYEATDTNYRLALIKEAKALIQDNDIVNALITKEVIGMLAPAEAIPEYQQMYINKLPDVDLRTMMTEQEQEVLSRDLGSQVPSENTEEEYDDNNDKVSGNDDYEEEGGFGEGTNEQLMGGPGTPIQSTGLSYYPQQAVAVQLTGMNTGR